MVSHHQNQASGPLSPAVQMATDAAELLTEDQRLSMALDWVNSAKKPESLNALKRMIGVSQATIQDIEISRIADRVPQDATVDPDFMRLFLGYYTSPRTTTVTAAYKSAVLHVGQHKLECCVSAEHSVRHALKASHLITKGHA